MCVYRIGSLEEEGAFKADFRESHDRFRYREKVGQMTEAGEGGGDEGSGAAPHLIDRQLVCQASSRIGPRSTSPIGGFT